MQFTHTWQKVLSGEKTATRRIVKPDEYLARQSMFGPILPTVFIEGHPKWSVGKTYVVQPGRNHPALIYNPDHPCYGIDIIPPGDSHYELAKSGEWNYAGQGYIQARIRITGLRRCDVRNISAQDAQAEGFDSIKAFMDTWLKMHDPAACKPFSTGIGTMGQPVLYLWTRPNERYQAWVIEFELVKEA